ncbi:MAG: flagella basal body P-ring formation protein FlgA [Bryobacteraceae bacterium]
MRFILSLVLLIRLADAADSASVSAEPALQCAASRQSAFGLYNNQRPTPRLAPGPLFWEHESSEEAVTSRQPTQVEPGAIAKQNLNNTPHVIVEAEIERAIRVALGGRKGELRLEIMAHSRDVLSAGEAEFPLSGASNPSPLHPETAILWRGYWRTPDGRSTPIWARVRALCPRLVIRLRADVARGAPLAASVLEEISVLDSAFRAEPPETLSEYEGKVLRHFAKAGSIISPRQITDPPVVLRYSMVRVDVNSGSLQLRVKARAETDGQAGETIRLMIPGGHRQFLATIQPDGSAVLNVAVDRPNHPASTQGESNAL